MDWFLVLVLVTNNFNLFFVCVQKVKRSHTRLKWKYVPPLMVEVQGTGVTESHHYGIVLLVGLHWIVPLVGL